MHNFFKNQIQKPIPFKSEKAFYTVSVLLSVQFTVSYVHTQRKDRFLLCYVPQKYRSCPSVHTLGTYDTTCNIYKFFLYVRTYLSILSLYTALSHIFVHSFIYKWGLFYSLFLSLHTLKRKNTDST